MSTFLSKLFPGTTSGSSSSGASAELGSMESLCAAINSVIDDKSLNAGEKAAELIRKNKELFERKPNDVEAFLLHCSPHVGSAAMVAAIKGMFDSAMLKNNEAGTDRAVELLNHYVDENNFVGEHLRMVPEIIYPLLRMVGVYCMTKKDKPEIGQRIILKTLASMFPRDSDCPKILTSAHSTLFACALKTKDYAMVAPFIDPYVDGVANENNVLELPDDHHLSVITVSRFGKKSQFASMGSTMPPIIPFINPKFVVEYFYNGACVLIELKKYEEALLLLETSVSIPALSLQELHVEGYKKYILLSLLLHGKITDPSIRSYSRNLKTRFFGDYKPLVDVQFKRTEKTHCKVDDIVYSIRDRLKRDGNTELAKLVVLEMKKKTILSIVKMFSSIRLQEVTEMSFMKTRQQTTELIDALVRENRITVRVVDNMIFWSELSPLPSKSDIESKIKLVDKLNDVLSDKNSSLKNGSSRPRPPVVTINDDEGLSMPPVDH